MAILIALLLLLWNIKESRNTYPATIYVVELQTETDTVLCTDFNGNLWSFNGIEDWAIDDQVSCIMDTNGTEIIYDDTIRETRYTGWR